MTTTLASAGLLLGLAGCHADEAGFYDEIFPCSLSSIADPCGPGRNGKPMACFAGGQFGDGGDFCAESCDPAGPPGPGFACTSSGALLRFCRPSLATPDPGTGCPKGLQCYRTSLLFDSGVCLAMKVCDASSSQCNASYSHRTCGATLLLGVVSASAAKMLHADHLACLQETCSSTTMDCQPGEICLARFSDRPAIVPDICVPQCFDGHCPPGFGCDRSATSPGDPPACIPGLPSARCSNDIDCLIGDCVDTGAGFGTCALGCNPSNGASYCAGLDFSDHIFTCVESVPGRGFHCMSPNPFQGSLCASDLDCADPQRCSFYSPYLARESGRGECRTPCDGQGHCPQRGGLPNICLAGGHGGCYPGSFGLPCADSSECLAGLTCEPVVADARYPMGTSVCTLPCPASGNCDDEPVTAKGGFCSLQDGFCHLAGAPNTPCAQDVECSSRYCDVPAQGAGSCAASNGG